MAKKSSFEYYNHLLIITVIVVLILGGYFVLKKQVPYTIEEVYTAQEPYYESVFYNETFTEEVLVPYASEQVISDTIQKTSTASKYTGGTGEFLGIKECHFKDFEYNIEYLGMPQSADDYNYYTRLGYKDGKYIIGVNVCNEEPTTLNAEFDICRTGSTLANCDDSADWSIPANRCRIFTLYWHTAFDPEKRIELIPRIVSKKTVCRAANSDDEFKEVHYKPENVIYDDGIANKKEMLSEAGLILKTDSGYLRMPKYQPDYNPAASYLYSTSTKTRMPVTEYRTELKTTTVPKSRLEERFRVVEKKREVTKFRSLWQELKIRIFG